MQHKSYFVLEKRNWESTFFQKRYGTLKFVNETLFVNNDPSDLKVELAALLAEARANYDLIDFHLPAHLFQFISICEDFNFRLIDSQIIFKTLIDETTLDQQNFDLQFDELQLRMFEHRDLSQIISLTNENLTYNPFFVSRFKNLDYFKEDDASRYFEQYILNMAENENSFCNVLVDVSNKVDGYFIYEKKGTLNNLPVYKGILTLITEQYRGKGTHLAMQYHLLKQFKEKKFYIENATQLSNFPVIKNHIKSQRTLENIRFIMMWKNPNHFI